MSAKEIKHLQNEIDELGLHYRSKDKECRLLALRIKEYQRISRFKQLKPLDSDLVQSELPGSRAKSTMRNQHNDTYNPDVKSLSKRLINKEVRAKSRGSRQNKTLNNITPLKNKDL